MVQTLIPSHIQEFMLGRVKTHEELRVLVTLLKNHEGNAITCTALASELNEFQPRVEEALAALIEADLIVRVGDPADRYAYAPARPELDAHARFVGTLHERHHVELVWVLAENAITRLRRAARLACLLDISAEVRHALFRFHRRERELLDQRLSNRSAPSAA
ncbi:MAG: hypothetical protein ACOY0T_30835 [Myxococcota bacterium]